jgi:hypothetical protein
LGQIFLSIFGKSKNTNEILISFINDGAELCHFDKLDIEKKYGEGSTEKFLSEIISCTKLANDKYRNILVSIGFVISDFTLKGIPEEKLIILIELGTIQMNESNLAFIRQQYPDQVIPYIKRNIDSYVDKVVNKENLDINELLSVIQEDIPDEYKLRLLALTSDHISIQLKNLTMKVQVYILSNNFDPEDIEYCLKIYSNSDKPLRSILLERIVEKISDVEEKEDIPVSVLDDLFEQNGISINEKINLFQTNLKRFEKHQIKPILEKLEMVELLKIYNFNAPTIEANAINLIFLEVFKEKGLIRSYSEKENRYIVRPQKNMLNGEPLLEDA